jgi:tetratricopeptide (TPR) repeat protein
MELFEKGVETGDLSEASLAQTYRNMGITCSRDRKYEKAIEFYNNALKLKPTEPWKDLVNKGNALSYLKRFEEAVALYDQAQKLKPQYNEAYFNRGITYERQDKLPEAVEQFKKAYMHGLRSPALQERFNFYELVDKVPPIASPKGYEWGHFVEVRGFFLKPDGWTVSKQPPRVYVISKEKPDEENEDSYQTGMRIQVLVEVGKKGAKETAVQIAERRIDEKKVRFEIIKEWRQNAGPLEALGLRIHQPAENKKRTIHNIIIANTETGTIHDVSFQAPAEEWDDAWKIAEPMMRFLLIDDEL